MSRIGQGLRIVISRVLVWYLVLSGIGPGENGAHAIRDLALGLRLAHEEQALSRLFRFRLK